MNKTYIWIAMIVCVAILDYGFINYKAKMNVLKDQQAKELRMNMMYDKCMREAYETYSIDWEAGCKFMGRAENCSLPAYRANEYESRRIHKEDTCVKLFKN